MTKTLVRTECLKTISLGIFRIPSPYWIGSSSRSSICNISGNSGSVGARIVTPFGSVIALQNQSGHSPQILDGESAGSDRRPGIAVWRRQNPPPNEITHWTANRRSPTTQAVVDVKRNRICPGPRIGVEADAICTSTASLPGARSSLRINFAEPDATSISHRYVRTPSTSSKVNRGREPLTSVISTVQFSVKSPTQNRPSSGSDSRPRV